MSDPTEFLLRRRLAEEFVEDREALDADPGWEATAAGWMEDVAKRLIDLDTPTTPERLAELRAMPYRTGYLLSPEWQFTRENAIAAAGHKCSRCPQRRHLDVHHLTYDRLGDELATDIVVLCRMHHQQQHEAEAR